MSVVLANEFACTFLSFYLYSIAENEFCVCTGVEYKIIAICYI